MCPIHTDPDHTHKASECFKLRKLVENRDFDALALIYKTKGENNIIRLPLKLKLKLELQGGTPSGQAPGKLESTRKPKRKAPGPPLGPYSPKAKTTKTTKSEKVKAGSVRFAKISEIADEIIAEASTPINQSNSDESITPNTQYRKSELPPSSLLKDRAAALKAHLDSGKPIEGKGLRFIQNKDFMIDSGASYLMVNNTKHFKPGSFQPIKGRQVYLGDESPIAIEGTGSMTIRLSPTENRVIDKVLYVPQLAECLLSISHLIGNSPNDFVIFGRDQVFLHNIRNGQIIEIGKRHGSLYYMNVTYDTNDSELAIASKVRACLSQAGLSKRQSYLLWHIRLGHVGYEKVVKTLKAAKIPFDFSADNATCLLCKRIGMKRNSYRGEASRPTTILGKICEDTFPLEEPTLDGDKHCSYLIDVATYTKWLLFHKHKSDAPGRIMKLLTRLEVLHGQKVITIQTDGGELNCKRFKDYCQQANPEIELRFSPPDTQALNGFVERHIGLDKIKAGCFLAQAKLSAAFFQYAIEYVIYISDYTYTEAIGKSPFEARGGDPPTSADFKTLKLFGCLCFVLVPKKHRGKRTSISYSKAEPAIFLGYKGKGIVRVWKYRTEKVHDEYHVTFCEHSFPGLDLEDQSLNPLLNGDVWAKKGIEYSGPILARGLDDKEKDGLTQSFGDDPISFSMDDDVWDEFITEGEICLHTTDEGMEHFQYNT